MKFRTLIYQDEEGMFVAECPSLPGCVSQGKTRKEAIENIKDAMKGYLESLKKHNEAIGTLNSIIKQAGLTREEFFKLI